MKFFSRQLQVLNIRRNLPQACSKPHSDKATTWTEPQDTWRIICNKIESRILIASTQWRSNKKPNKQQKNQEATANVHSIKNKQPYHIARTKLKRAILRIFLFLFLVFDENQQIKNLMKLA